jgi:1-acyl-sn-glycerol-3-phosphate acyltransferase
MKPLTTSSMGGKLSIYVRSAIFLAGTVLATLLMGSFFPLLRPFSFRVRSRLARAWVDYVLWLLRTVCGLTYEVKGQENIPPLNGIILCKHQSAWETIALQQIFPRVVFILKRELLRIPFLGWALASLDPIAIDRQAKAEAMKQVISDGAVRLERGHWIVIFPEGTRVPPGHKGRFGKSGGILAHSTGYPVVPVAHNAGEFWSRRAFVKYPGVIQVRIGSPIYPEGLSSNEINQRVEHWIDEQMSKISTVPVEGTATEPA